MEQMNNILLGSSAKVSKSSPGELSSSSGSDAFLAALNQVSNTQSEGFSSSKYDSNTSASISASFSSAQNDILSEDEADVNLELILAQIDLTGKTSANDNNEEAVGNQLPPELIDGSLGVKSVFDEMGQDNFLSQLSEEQQLALASFAELDAESLTQLSAEELAALVENYNAQAANNAVAPIALPAGVLAWLQDKANIAADNSQENENAELGAQMVADDKIKTGVLAKDKLHILGNEEVAKPVDAKLAGAELAKAELNVTLDTQMAKKFELSQGINAASMAVNELGNSIGDTNSDDSAALKALQNQSSFTPVHKSEVPQFQLSLKQGEAGLQMQEMIKKFSPVMQQQLITMVSKGIQQAEIRLDPPELGHMLVKINVQGDQTQVQFQVAHSQTKDLVEQALPKLRDLLAQEGMQLSDSHVSQGDGGRGDKDQRQGGERYGGEQLDDNAAQETNLMANRTSHSNSAIDYYA
ncbi:flagellar hook-length control protein FliK [Shewanella sp. SR44-3]|uniref:flagellar hook-length control protein FliK n=1 Tax=Shewanella sp. SR44-3 TaxID=2760936 RepID=UPI0015FBD7B7|nr:flagellar hook-length control protein FliK [Shewanella sp. SR44-3]MBB1268077.1 flagellar hook-length control protein FliK [Shewanella sp. SR44-3]